MKYHSRLSLAAAVCCLALTLAACGDREDAAPPPDNPVETYTPDCTPDQIEQGTCEVADREPPPYDDGKPK